VYYILHYILFYIIFVFAFAGYLCIYWYCDLSYAYNYGYMQYP